MEDLLSVLSVILATTAISILMFDLRQRAIDRKALTSARKEAEKAAAALADLHNKQIDQIRQINDKVMSHEMILKTSAGQTHNNNAMKRF